MPTESHPIRIHNCLFTQDKRIICIQILFLGYNLILVKAFSCGKKLLLESDSGNCLGIQTKGFLVFEFFPDDGIIAQGQKILPQPNALTKIRLYPENKI